MGKFDNLRNDPALAFVSAADDTAGNLPDQQQAAGLPDAEALAPMKHGAPPKGYRLNPEFIEVKSKRVQLVFRPSTYKAARAAAKRAGVSLNEYIHQLIEQATAEQGAQ